MGTPPTRKRGESDAEYHARWDAWARRVANATINVPKEKKKGKDKK